MKILYFTSTGNNYYISQNLGGELLSIPQLIKKGEYEIKDESVGIVFPVFYANAPKMVRQFVKKAKIKTDYLFLITSYGSDGDQNALRLMLELFDEKGINVNYTNSVLMVDNFLPTFDMSQEKAIKNDEDIDRQIQAIKKDIEMKKDFRMSKKMFTDVPFIEKILETTMTEKFHILVGDDCTNCRICSQVCPCGNITLTEEGPVIGDNCEFCLGCVHHCRNNVLTINDEKNSHERFINPHVKISKIIKSNNVLKN